MSKARGAVVAMKAPAGLAPRRKSADVALIVLATLAAIAVAKWAQAFLIPLTAGTLIAYALKPVVGTLERLHIHRVIGAVLVLLSRKLLLQFQSVPEGPRPTHHRQP